MAKRRTTFPELSRILGNEDFRPAPAKARPKPKFELSGFLGDLLNAPIRFGKQIGAAGAATLGAGLATFAPQKRIPFTGATGLELANVLAQGLKQRFPETGVVKAGKGKKREAVVDVLKQAGATASFAIPFGRGAGLLQKAFLPGAAVGGLQEAARPRATPISVATQAGLGGL